MRGREKEKRKLPGARECVGVSGCPARERPRCVISPFLKCTSLGEAGCPGDCLAFRQDNSIKKKKNGTRNTDGRGLPSSKSQLENTMIPLTSYYYL